MSKRLDLLRCSSSQPDEWIQKPKTPGNRTDKTDKSPFGSFVSSYPGPFSIPHDHRIDPLDQFGEHTVIAELDDGLIPTEAEHLAMVELLIAKARANAADKPHTPPDPVDAEPVKSEAGTRPKEAMLTMTAAREPRDQRQAYREGLAREAILAWDPKR